MCDYWSTPLLPHRMVQSAGAGQEEDMGQLGDVYFIFNGPPSQ